MKTTTAERDPAAAAKLEALIADIGVAMVTTVTPDGALHSRPMLTLAAEQPGELLFLTSDDSRTAGDLSEEQAVNVSYADVGGDRYVSVSGQARVEDDRDRIGELWQPRLERFFPRGERSPHLRLLRVSIESAEYWDASASRMQPLREAPEKSGADGASRQAGAAGGPGRTEHTQIAIRATPTTG